MDVFLLLKDTVSFLYGIFFKTDLFCPEREAKYATPKCATLACGLFRAEVNQDLADSRKTFASPLTT